MLSSFRRHLHVSIVSVKVVFGLERLCENENPEIPRHPHTTNPTHTQPHILQNKLKQPHYKMHLNEIVTI